MKQKNIIIAIVVVIVLFATTVLILLNRDLEVNLIESKYSIDINDPEAVVEYADYVFVGYINEKINTEYIYPDEETAEPFTNFSVSVIKNIKGQLIGDKEIVLKKIGGVSKSGKEFYKYGENDVFPEKGKLYVILATGDEEGNLRAFLPTAVIEISDVLNAGKKPDLKDANFIEKLEKNEKVELYQASADKKLNFHSRDRYYSVYDGSGNNVEKGVPYETAQSQVG